MKSRKKREECRSGDSTVVVVVLVEVVKRRSRRSSGGGKAKTEGGRESRYREEKVIVHSGVLFKHFTASIYLYLLYTITIVIQYSI